MGMSRRGRLRVRQKRWAMVRRRALERDGYRCRQESIECAGRLEVDHINPIHRGGDTYHLDNLQTLCRHHHLRKTLAERRKLMIRNDSPRQARWKERIDDSNAASSTA